MSVLEHSAVLNPRESGRSLLESAAAIPASIVCLLCMVSIFNGIEPVGAERASSHVGSWVLMKLMLAACVWVLGGWGLLNSPRVRAVLLSPPGMLLALLCLAFLFASVFALPETALISFAAAMILGGYLLFTATAVCVVGPRAITSAAIVGTTIFLLIAWVLYLFVPSLGRFHEYTDAYRTVTRMGGIAHPNPLARDASVCVLLCVALLRAGGTRIRDIRPRMMLYAVLGLSCMTLVVTMSRTAVIALFAAILLMMFDKLLTRRAAILGLAAVSTLVAVLFAATLLSRGQSITETAVAVTTKSDSVKELTSITGRTTIWAEAWDLIRQRPLRGWGLDSAASVMSVESSGTHNLLLHNTFSGGAIAGMLTFALLLITLYHATTSTEPLYRGIATYVLLAGLVEDTMFESFPSVLTILWIVVLLDPIAKAYQRRDYHNRKSTAPVPAGTNGRADAPARTLAADSLR
jgi:O-antigen ligase